MSKSGEAQCLAKRKCSINVSSFLFLLTTTCQSHIRTGSRKGLGIEKTCVQTLALSFTGNEILVKLLRLCKPQFHHVSYINSNGNAHLVQLEGLSETMTVQSLVPSKGSVHASPLFYSWRGMFPWERMSSPALEAFKPIRSHSKVLGLRLQHRNLRGEDTNQTITVSCLRLKAHRGLDRCCCVSLKRVKSPYLLLWIFCGTFGCLGSQFWNLRAGLFTVFELSSLFMQEVNTHVSRHENSI